jgi:hypothetical protein
LDDRKHSISPDALYARLGSESAPIIVGVRRDADFAGAETLVADAFHRSPDHAVRLTSSQDYHLVQLDALRDQVLFWLVSNGAFEEIVGVDADIASHSLHPLTVRAKDNEFVVSLDGIWVFTAFDKALSQAGRIALWSKGDSVTRFDSIAITAIPATDKSF